MNNRLEPYTGMPLDLENLALLAEEASGDSACICDRDFANWPLAMAYVPMQKWEEPYSPARGLQAGTIFPSLDLPFKGRKRR